MGEGDTAGTTRSADTQTLRVKQQREAAAQPRGLSSALSDDVGGDVSAPQEGRDV